MINESKYGIHDLSRVELDPVNNLPRFNMPFELGVFLGCNKYSEARRQKLKKCMIIDANTHRYKISLSDLRLIVGLQKSDLAALVLNMSEDKKRVTIK